jgi:hypothetical protein
MKKSLLITALLWGLLGSSGCALKRQLLSPAQPLAAQPPAASPYAASPAAHQAPAPHQASAAPPAANAPQYTAQELRRMRVRSAASYGASSNPANCFT